MRRGFLVERWASGMIARSRGASNKRICQAQTRRCEEASAAESGASRRFIAQGVLGTVLAPSLVTVVFPSVPPIVTT
jgi:hypothetical protein